MEERKQRLGRVLTTADFNRRVNSKSEDDVLDTRCHLLSRYDNSCPFFLVPFRGVIK